MTHSLQEIRKKINSVDDEIIFLLLKRLKLSKEARDWKSELSLDLEDEEREAEIIDRISKLSKGEISEENMRKIYSIIFELLTLRMCGID